MNGAGYEAEIDRIRKEYGRRAKEIPADYYSLEKPANRFMYMQRLRAARQLLEQKGLFPLKNKKILEIGCGAGGWLPDFEKWGAEQSGLSGIELDENRIHEAKKRLPSADLRAGEASALPWAGQSFDLVLQSTVFSSILLKELKQKIAGEMLRVLKPGAVIVWYDFFWNNPRNPHVRGIKEEEIKKLFPECEIISRKTTLAPPLTRVFAPWSFPFCRFLESMKFLNTHYLACIRSLKN